MARLLLVLAAGAAAPRATLSATLSQTFYPNFECGANGASVDCSNGEDFPVAEELQGKCTYEPIGTPRSAEFCEGVMVACSSRAAGEYPSKRDCEEFGGVAGASKCVATPRPRRTITFVKRPAILQFCALISGKKTRKLATDSRLRVFRTGTSASSRSPQIPPPHPTKPHLPPTIAAWFSGAYPSALVLPFLPSSPLLAVFPLLHHAQRRDLFLLFSNFNSKTMVAAGLRMTQREC